MCHRHLNASSSPLNDNGLDVLSYCEGFPYRPLRYRYLSNSTYNDVINYSRNVCLVLINFGDLFRVCGYVHEHPVSKPLVVCGLCVTFFGWKLGRIGSSSFGWVNIVIDSYSTGMRVLPFEGRFNSNPYLRLSGLFVVGKCVWISVNVFR